MQPRSRDAGASVSESPTKKGKKQKKHYLLRKEHLRTYGLQITARSARTGHPESLSCKFCVVFGREAKAGAKRKATENTKFFKSPFRPDNYVSHLNGVHAQRWAEYKTLPDEEKDAYFISTAPFVSTMIADFEANEPLRFSVSGEVVDNLIGGLLFDEGADSISREAALEVFKLAELSMASLPVKDREYIVNVAQPRQYHLCVGFVGHGASFRLTCDMLQLTKEVTGMSLLGSVTATQVASYARIASAVILQKLRDILSESWAFSVALDTSTVEGTGFMDVRIRACPNGKLINAHALALPLRDRHTGEIMFTGLCKLLDGVCPDWKSKVISISTDGDRSMVGSVRGVATRMEQVAKPGFIRVWCGLHQVDLVMQRVFKALKGECFYKELTDVISYLRRQSNLVERMKGKCPKIADTRWLSTGRVTSWLAKNRLAVVEYLDEKSPPCKPKPAWWVIVIAVAKTLKEVNPVVQGLQGLTTLLATQAAALSGLITSICKLGDVEGPLCSPEIQDRERKAEYVVKGRFAVSLASTRGFVEDLGSVCIQYLNRTQMTEDDVDAVLRTLANMLVSMVDGLHDVIGGSVENALRAENVPAVLPHHLAKLRPRDLSSQVLRQRDRLSSFLTNAEIEAIEIDHQDLIRAYEREHSLRECLDKCGDRTTFDEGWSFLGKKFAALCKFAGGLATVFPSTATVESDFSLIKWEKNEFRKGLTDFSLEGILHCKQYKSLLSHETS